MRTKEVDAETSATKAQWAIQHASPRHLVNSLPMSAHMCDNAHMDTTIRNLDRHLYRALKAQASLEGRTIGDAVNEAIRAYVGWPGRREKSGSLRSLRPQEFPAGNERLSEEIDAVVYGD